MNLIPTFSAYHRSTNLEAYIIYCPLSQITLSALPISSSTSFDVPSNTFSTNFLTNYWSCYFECLLRQFPYQRPTLSLPNVLFADFFLRHPMLLFPPHSLPIPSPKPGTVISCSLSDDFFIDSCRCPFRRLIGHTTLIVKYY